ncbi:MAG: DNA-directed RNA polymerase subunit omega [Clostridia bacterium]|nr:DNA-directed RNA polymerase subunit omega [Clostridia bacterium]
MMFNPDLRNVLKDHTSRYSLVTAIAKRARDISTEAQENDEILNDKPVSIALDEIISGKFQVVEPEEIRNI